jgi:hypothetical protein
MKESNSVVEDTDNSPGHNANLKEKDDQNPHRSQTKKEDTEDEPKVEDNKPKDKSIVRFRVTKAESEEEMFTKSKFLLKAIYSKLSSLLCIRTTNY